MTYNEAWNLVCAPLARLLTGNPDGCDFEVLALFEREMDGDVDIGSDMHDQVIGWEDKAPVNDEQVMEDGHEGFQRDVRASCGMGVSVAGVHLSGETNRDETPAVDGDVWPFARRGVTGGGDAVSRFGSFGCAMSPTVEACNVEPGGRREAGSVSMPDGDFQLMYVHRFLRQ